MLLLVFHTNRFWTVLLHCHFRSNQGVWLGPSKLKWIGKPRFHLWRSQEPETRKTLDFAHLDFHRTIKITSIKLSSSLEIRLLDVRKIPQKATMHLKDICQRLLYFFPRHFVCVSKLTDLRQVRLRLKGLFQPASFGRAGDPRWPSAKVGTINESRTSLDKKLPKLRRWLDFRKQ